MIWLIAETYIKARNTFRKAALLPLLLSLNRFITSAIGSVKLSTLSAALWFVNELFYPPVR
jgi:hypothetical protein